MKKNHYRLIIALGWSILIFILLIIPGADLPKTPRVPFLDKIAHFLLFGIQVFLWSEYSARKRHRNLFWLIFLFSSIYGIAMEFVQKYGVRNRSFEMEDILADVAGSFAGWVVCHFLINRKLAVDRTDKKG